MANGVGHQVAGRYRLIRELGRGGMGVVWEAHDTLLDRPVAVKEVLLPPGMPPAEQARLFERTSREARTAARLNHRAIVAVYDVAQEDGRPWIVMELLEAKTLESLMPLPPRRIAEIGRQVLAALTVAHQAGVLHRDVKPSNILIGRDGRVVLSDFGIAVVQGDTSLTQTGMVTGSPGFLAPERARGADAGPESDLWSLGATLYAASVGRSPFERSDAISTLSALLTEEADIARAAPELRAVLAGMLRREPGHRIPAAEADRMLAAIESGARPAPPPPAPARPSPARPAGPMPSTGQAYGGPPPPPPRPGTPYPGTPYPPAAPHRTGPQVAPPPGSPWGATPGSGIRQPMHPVAGHTGSHHPQGPSTATSGMSGYDRHPPARRRGRKRTPFVVALAVAFVILVPIIVVLMQNWADPDSTGFDKAGSVPAANGESKPRTKAPTKSPGPKATKPTTEEPPVRSGGSGTLKPYTERKLGWSIDRPADAKVSGEAEARRFIEPGYGAGLLYIQTQELYPGDSPQSVLEEQESGIQANSEGGATITDSGIKTVDSPHGEAADWEVIYGNAESRVHEIRRAIVTDQTVYVITWSISEDQWKSRVKDGYAMLNSFTPAGR
ncbi:serine/threonine-protein kinase [Rhizohabitans arisaemae]|uniref:serine/threonine-protein kinase n=1 Tax=Rhizohabitans arisaemae TaxID=2720610 RepID=UPI0024B064F7|nr:serine/threonine-protein kinase [Rhizohabitans arisaemae]